MLILLLTSFGLGYLYGVVASVVFADRPRKSTYRGPVDTAGSGRGLALSGLIRVLLCPAARDPLTTAIILFVAFGVGSVAFWRFFERRKARAELTRT